MAVETEADRLAFFDSGDFGVVANITPNAGPVFSVPGQFFEPHLTAGVRQENGYGNQAVLSGQKPTFLARSSDLAGVKSGRATVEIVDGLGAVIGVFGVHDTKPDGTGMTTLHLIKA